MMPEQEKKYDGWLAASPHPLGPNEDATLVWMKEQSVPLTRENYLELAYPDGLPDPWTAELEATLPPEIRAQQE